MIDQLFILPYGTFIDSLCGSMRLDYYSCDLGFYVIKDSLYHIIMVHKNTDNILLDSLGKPVLHNKEIITHKSAYNIIDQYVKQYRRTKKLERITKEDIPNHI